MQERYTTLCDMNVTFTTHYILHYEYHYTVALPLRNVVNLSDNNTFIS